MASESEKIRLTCRPCVRCRARTAVWCDFCEDDFGPLEVDYHYDKIKPLVSRQLFESRPNNMWRWKEFLPLNGEPTVGLHVGGTPLSRSV